MSSRRKSLLAREASAQRIPRDAALASPVEIRRLRDKALADARDPLFGSELGRLHLTGRLTSTQLAAGKRWEAIVANYSSASRSPRGPQTVRLDGLGGVSTDTTTDAKEVRKHERATAAWIEGRDVLRRAGAEQAVESVCVHDRAPAGWAELDALQAGLSALSTWWTSKKR